MASPGEFPGEFQAGDIVGGTYLILAYVGRGSMGHLYHVRHTMLNTEYALKTLTSDKVTELDWKRFQNEAQATAVMNHPNVVTIYNLGFHDRRLPFYVMDLLRGVDLAQKVRAEGPLEIKEAIAVFIEVCAGIGYAHKKGIIHRDIKPGNVFLLERPDPAGAKVKVVDFGIAKLTVTKNQETQALTAVGDVVGTPFYMSPEQCMGLRVDARSDIYSLGCTLYEALTGSLPFKARNPTETMFLHQSAPPPRLEKGAGGRLFPDALEYIIATTLAKEPSERYQTMDQLARDLAALIEGDRPVVTMPGGATSGSVEAASTLVASNIASTQPAAKKQLVALVSAVVAGVFAISCYAYWQSRHMVKTTQQLALTEQLPKPGPKVLEKTAEDLAAEKIAYERETASLEKAQDSAALDVNKPFSTKQKIRGKECLCFEFPTDVVIGELSNSDPPDWKKASGHVKFETNRGVIFKPDEVVKRDPDCLKRFKPGDIYGVEFAKDADSQILRAMLKIPDVQKLDLYNAKQLAGVSANTLKQFHNLRVFVGPTSPSDGNALAQAKCWGNLEQLYLPSAKNVLPLLKEVKTSKSFTKLGLGPSQLTSDEYKIIASMSKLDYLDLNGNRVTNNELAVLSTLHNLIDLNLINSDLDLSALNTIKRFEKLRNLYISSRKLSPDDFEKIKKALPKMKVRQTMK